MAAMALSKAPPRLPDDVVELVLLQSTTAASFGAAARVCRQWARVARHVRVLMKTRFARVEYTRGRYMTMDVEWRRRVVGRSELHGVEELVQNWHRVGGGGCETWYMERSYEEGVLHGAEVEREVNACWWKLFDTRPAPPDSLVLHPYEGLAAIDSMRRHGGHYLLTENERRASNFVATLSPEDVAAAVQTGIALDRLGEVQQRREWHHGVLISGAYPSPDSESVATGNRSAADEAIDYLRHASTTTASGTA
jgi:hypothetical protein